MFVVTKLNIPDRLTDGAKTAAELGTITGSNETSLFQVMRLLAALRYFSMDTSGRFGLTAKSEELRADKGSWLREYVLLWGDQLHLALGSLLPGVQSGQVAFEIAFGDRLWEYYLRADDARQQFEKFMSAVTDWHAPVIASALDCRRHRHVVDIGGGRGSLVTALLEVNPHLRGTVFDQPHLEEAAKERLASAGLADRGTFVGGDFFHAVPRGGNMYVIRHVLHDWPDHGALRILQRVRSAMDSGSELLIIEGVVNDDPRTDMLLKMRSVEQMAWTGGRVRTFREFETLLSAAGFCVAPPHKTSIMDCDLLFANPR